MMRAAPASAAPLIADRPTPPQPITATVSPGSTLAVWNTAPTPVITPQPISAARSSGMSSRIFTTAFSCTSICSANDGEVGELVHRLAAVAGEAPGARPAAASRLVLVAERGCPVRQCSQWPQNTDRQVMTWSPGLT